MIKWWRSWIGSWGWSCIYKYFKYGFNVKICNSLDWNFVRSVCAKVVRIMNGGVENDMGAEVVRGDGEGFE